jgi:small subunit ribosomal protein S2
MEVDGTFEKITKKERLLLTREKDRLRKMFGGIETMTRLPGALFIIDIKKEHIAVNEARILGIPTIALVDTNADPEEVDFPIPCNDDSINTIEMVMGIVKDAINKGSEIAKVRRAELASQGDQEQKSEKTVAKPKIKRKLRERKPESDDNAKKDAPAKEEAPKESSEKSE